MLVEEHPENISWSRHWLEKENKTKEVATDCKQGLQISEFS